MMIDAIFILPYIKLNETKVLLVSVQIAVNNDYQEIKSPLVAFTMMYQQPQEPQLQQNHNSKKSEVYHLLTRSKGSN